MDPTLLTAAVSVIAGYVASVFTWAKIKLWVNGAKAEAAKLEAQLAALKAKL